MSWLTGSGGGQNSSDPSLDEAMSSFGEESDSFRTLEQVAESYADEFNSMFRERDYLVMCLLDSGSSARKRRGSVLVKNKTFGGISFPAKSVKAFEDLVDSKYSGSTLLAPTFLSLWSMEFARAVLKCIGIDETERVAHILNIMTATGRTTALLNHEISAEISAENNSRDTLFRSGSTATVLFSIRYHGREGARFLHVTTASLVKSVIAFKSIIEAKDVEKFAQPLSSFFESLDNAFSSGTIPRSMVEVLQHLNIGISQRFASMSRAILSVFVFVRFLCPTIVAPHAYGLLREAPAMIQQKNLILFGKLISNIASGVRFDGLKEMKMTALNVYVDQYGPVVREFFDRLALASPNELKKDSIPSSGSGLKLFGRSGSDHRVDLSKSLEVLLDFTTANYETIDMSPDDLLKIQGIRREMIAK